MSHESIVTSAALLIGLVACATDIRTRRIPNALTFGGALAALVTHTVLSGLSGAATAFSGWLVGTLLFLPFFLLRGMGGGDVKLLAALGAWLGPKDAIWLAVYASLIGGGMGLVVALAHGYLKTALRNLGAMLAFWSTVGPKPVPSVTLDSAQAPKLAYALPIFAGTVITLWL